MITNRVPCSKCSALSLPETIQTNNGICARCAKQQRSPYSLPPELAALIVPIPKGEEAKLIRQAHISSLHPSLQPLLANELSLGNSVAETAQDWPKHGSIFIMLALPFLAPVEHLPEQVTYHEVNDPHYWKADYFQSETKHILACRF
jgi:hypothetical protein